MTKPTTPDDVVKALELVTKHETGSSYMDTAWLRKQAEKALPAASRAVEAEKALDYLIERCRLVYFYPDKCDRVLLDSPFINDCPEIIRKKLEGK